MIELVYLHNKKTEKKEVMFTVMISYRDSPEASSVWLFSNYVAAKMCLNGLLPAEEYIQESESFRIQEMERQGVINPQRYDRDYYYNHDYYEHWNLLDGSSDSIPEYYVALDKLTIRDNFEGTY